MKLNFAKYQGAGNDFVLIDAREPLPVELTRARVAMLCDRRFGIGGDGLMTLENDPQGSDFLMRYFNCDGGQSTMCGNGGRAIARFADDLGVGGATKHFRATDGLHDACLNQDGTITLQMIDIDIVERVGSDFFLQSGSPHYIIVGQVYDEKRAEALRHKYNSNVNFVKVISHGKLEIRTFERGVEAETYACGTGATAAAVAVDFMSDNPLGAYDLQAVGGLLRVEFERHGDRYENVRLTGGAERVFAGVLEI